MANSDLFLGVKNMVAAKLGTRDIKLVLGSKLVYPLGKTDIQNAVVTCDSATYNGSNQIAQNIVVTLSGDTLVSGTDYTVTSNTGGTNAGSYNVTVSGTGNYEGSTSGTFTINKANQSAPTATGAKVYEGSTATATASGGGGQGSLEWSNGSTRTTIGSQTTKARWSGNGNYNASSWSNEVTLKVIEKVVVVAKYNVTSTSSPTPISFKNNSYDGTSGFSEIEIDGVVQPSVVSAYTFSTTGEHTVKYTLKDPTTISNYAFNGCSSLTSIEIPNSVRSIGSSAFNRCSGLTSITVDSNNTVYDSRNNCNAIIETATNTLRKGCINTVIPDNVTSIGANAFSYCSGLTSIDIPNGVTSIGNSAFTNCYFLTSCTIGSGVTSIGSSAFQSCTNLTSVTIGNSVTSIGGYAFAYCGSLTSIVSNRITAPTIKNNTFMNVKTGGTLTVPSGSSGYDTWMQNANYYLGVYNWTKVE